MKLFSYFISLLLLIAYCLLPAGCANIVPPGGGPIDSLPPRLVRSVPKDSSRNFTGNKIELVFNEYIELENVSQEIIVSPTTKSTPQVDRRLNIVTVKFRDTLEPNTTYSINFGNGIKDLNENNKAKQFTYTFSTGSNIDSLFLRGKVMNAETGKSDSTLIVALYKNLDDSAVSKERPRYYTKLNGEGEFVFKNLPPGKFNLVAIKDENGNKQYDLKNELIAFVDEPVDPAVDKASVTLYAFSESKEGVSPIIKASGNKKPVIEKLKVTGTNAGSGKLDILQNLELSFNVPVSKIDSSKVILTDEKFNPVKNYVVEADTSRKKFYVKWKLTENTAYKLILQKDFATDTTGNSYLRNDTLSFVTAKEAEYGSFKINFKNLARYKNPVLQIVSNGDVVASYPLKSNELAVRLFHPATYELRMLEDENGNGVWDTGNYWKKKQPEKITLLNTKLQVKPLWDTETTISL